MNHPISVLSISVALVVTIPLAARAGDHAGHSHPAADEPEAAAATAPADADVIAKQLPTYPLTECPVSGEPLGAMGDPVSHVYEGHLVRLCCAMCEGRFEADPATYLAKIDAAVIEQQLPDYPLDHCPVSGMKLGSMGEPYDHVHGTRLLRFCCGGCVEEFEEDPASYLAKIDAAAAEAREEK